MLKCSKYWLEAIMDNVVARIAHISDIHLYADQDNSLLGIQTSQSFQAVLDLLQAAKPALDLLVISGDLSQDSSAQSYRNIAKLTAGLNIPIYAIPGNHDNFAVMQDVYPAENISLQKQVIIKNWQIILLNSQQPQQVSGMLDPAELQFLQTCLSEYPNHQAIIVFHHQPVKIKAGWLNKIGLLNRRKLWQILQKSSQVKAVLFGHVHQRLHGHKNGIAYYSVPSCCIQFKKNSEEFALDDIAPGYRLLQLTADGTIVTRVIRSKNYAGIIDPAAKGY
jgi:Icc protein